MSNRFLERIKGIARDLHDKGKERTPAQLITAFRGASAKVRNQFAKDFGEDDKISAMTDEEFGDAFGAAHLILRSLKDKALFIVTMKKYAEMFPVALAGFLDELPDEVKSSDPKTQNQLHLLAKHMVIEVMRENK